MANSDKKKVKPAAVKKPVAKKKVVKKAKVEVPAPRKPGADGFMGSVNAENIMRQRLGLLAEDCEYSYVPHMEDIKKSATTFYRYEIVARHKDGDVVLHYRFQLDHNGRMVPDQVLDHVNLKLTQKGL
jgi:hypothetical protein